MSAEDRERIVNKARKEVEKGEEATWADRETHRGEEPHFKNEGQAPYISDNTEHRGKENTAGAFGKQEGTADAIRRGDDTRDKAVEKLEKSQEKDQQA